MGISARCPGCGGDFRGKDELARKLVTCRKCGQQFQLPENAPSLAAQATASKRKHRTRGSKARRRRIAARKRWSSVAGGAVALGLCVVFGGWYLFGGERPSVVNRPNAQLLEPEHRADEDGSRSITENEDDMDQLINGWAELTSAERSANIGVTDGSANGLNHAVRDGDDPSARRAVQLFSKLIASVSIPESHAEELAYIKELLAAWQRKIELKETTEPVVIFSNMSRTISRFLTIADIEKALDKPDRITHGRIPYLYNQDGLFLEGPVLWYGEVGFCCGELDYLGVKNNCLLMIRYEPK